MIYILLLIIIGLFITVLFLNNKVVKLKNQFVINKKLYKQDLMQEQLEVKRLNKLVYLSQKSLLAVIKIDIDGSIFYNSVFEKQFLVKDIRYLEDIANTDLKRFLSIALLSEDSIVEVVLGNEVYQTRILVIKNENITTGVLVQFYDITALKKSEEIQMQFLADVSHELKNPLASIKLSANILNREINNEITKILVDETNRMETLVDDLYNLNKLTSKDIEFELVNLSDLCTKYVGIYQLDDLNILLQVETNIYIQGNYDLLDRLIRNLLDNAFKYSDRQDVVLQLFNTDNKVNLTVQDFGVGIETKDLALIFNRFYRVDNSRTRKTGGSGLGLAIVQDVAKIHHALINVNSKLDSGSEFTILFNSVEEEK